MTVPGKCSAISDSDWPVFPIFNSFCFGNDDSEFDGKCDGNDDGNGSGDNLSLSVL